MLHAALLSLALLPLAPVSSTAALEPDGWTSLPIPALCQPGVELHADVGFGSGTHLRLDAYQLQSQSFHPAPYLPLIQLIELLESDARRAGTDLRCLRTAPPLLVRGSTAGVERARALVAELDRAGRAQRVRLDVSLEAVGAEQAVSQVTSSVELRSAETVLVGERETIGFLADFDVDVAAGGGAAYPSLGQLSVGKSAALTAWRTNEAGGVFVSGTLDLSELLQLESFETGSPELGVIEQPRIGCVVVHFSGFLDSEARLTVEVRGAPLAQPDWDLTIRAATRPDEPVEWRVVDLAWLESLGANEPTPEPGAGLRLPTNFPGSEGGLEPLPAAILWGELEASLQGLRSDRPLFAVAPGVLVAPANDLRVWSELDPLLEAACDARSTTTPLTVRCNGVEVRLSSAEGLRCSVQAGVESTALVDYRVELAQDFWMADPIVERLFDGFLMQAQISGDELVGSYWLAKSDTSRELAREEVVHGRVNLPHRRLSLGSIRVLAGEETRTTAGLSVGVGSL